MGWSSNANQLPESYAGNERGHEGFCFLFQDQCEVRARHAKKTMTWRLDVCYQGCIGLYFPTTVHGRQIGNRWAWRYHPVWTHDLTTGQGAMVYIKKWTDFETVRTCSPSH